jgi:hypothetical protein
MGREIRRVPADWKHPKNEKGRYIPLLDRSYEVDAAEWDEEYAQWQKGFKRGYGDGPRFVPKDDEYANMWFSEWSGRRPCPASYMPQWTETERTHIQMYEDTSEGTPISPVMDCPKKLARWLTDNGASAFGDLKATYEQWLSMCERGWAPSGIMIGGVMMSGVEGMAGMDDEKKS